MKYVLLRCPRDAHPAFAEVGFFVAFGDAGVSLCKYRDFFVEVGGEG